MRNSMKYLNWKELKPCVADLKKIYNANNADLALSYLDQAQEEWGGKYAVIFKSWRSNWDRLATFFQFTSVKKDHLYYQPHRKLSPYGQKCYQTNAL